AWLINLPRSTARRAGMEAQLAALNLPYTLHEATDGRAEWDRLVQTVDLAAFRRNVGREVLPGEVGCYHSHIAVCQALLASGQDVGLVMQDDSVSHPKFPTALQTPRAAKADWYFPKLNKIRAKPPLPQNKLGARDLNVSLGPPTGPGAYLSPSDLVGRPLPAM